MESSEIHGELHGEVTPHGDQEKTGQEKSQGKRGSKVYQATADVSIPKPVAQLDPNDENSDWITEGVTYPRGALISEDWLTPRDKKRAEAGDLSHVLQDSDQEIPEGAQAVGAFNEPEQGVFIPEHEAEATALKIAGHVVVPKEQQMEMLSSSAQHQAEYQAAAKEAGADQRPVVEMLQQDTPRVPDEVLYGAETPTGLPHYRGAAGGQEEALAANQEQSSSDDESDEDDSDSEAARPAPGKPSEEKK